jgi:hypothetical protein
MPLKRDEVMSDLLFVKAGIEDDKIFLHFSNVGGSLSAQYGYLPAFSIAGEDQVFHPAVVHLKRDDTVEVYSDKVASPAAVRYVGGASIQNAPCTTASRGKNVPRHHYYSRDKHCDHTVMTEVKLNLKLLWRIINDKIFGIYP